MNINITSLANMDAYDLSHSIAEGGNNAGRNTWNAAMNQAIITPILDTPEKLDAFRVWVSDCGAWSDEEIAAWTPQEVNALFLQWIAGDIRQLRADTLGSIDWEEASALQDAGQAPSSIWRDHDGEIFFSFWL
jgi:hypothetical protein